LAKKYYIYIIILTLCFVLPFVTKAQDYSLVELGTPKIRNYAQNDYKAYSQNWGIVQDKRGIMYFANGNGVLEYDGVSWRLTPAGEKNQVYAIGIDTNDRIFVGGAIDFGYLLPNNRMELEYVSLIEHIPTEHRNFGVKGRIYCTDNGVFYRAKNRLFRWHEDKMSSWNLSDSSSTHHTNDNFYVWQKNIGLQIVEGDSLLTLREDPFYKNNEIVEMVPHSRGKTLVYTREGGLFIQNNRGLRFPRVNIQPEPLNSQVNFFLEKNWLLFALPMRNSYFAFGTLRGGTVIMDSEGSVIRFINTEVGILNNTHISLAEDRQGALWIAKDNGIARADISSPISFWNDNAGLGGSAMSITRFNNRLMVATYQGLFELIDPGKKEEGVSSSPSHSFVFQPVRGISLPCWNLLSVEDPDNKQNSILLIANNRGLFQMSADNKFSLLDPGTYRIISRSKKYPNLFFAGKEDGILIFELSNTYPKKFKVLGMMPGYNERTMSIAEDSCGNLWLGTGYNGYFAISYSYCPECPNNKISDFSPFIKQFHRKDGLPPSEEYLCFPYRNRILYATQGGFFKFISSAPCNKSIDGKFVRDLSVTNFYPNSKYFSYAFKEDNSGDIWLQLISNELKKKIVLHGKLTPSGLFDFSIAPFKHIPYMDIYSILIEEDGAAWFAGDDGLFQFDARRTYNYSFEYSALIRKVVVEGDSIVYSGSYPLVSEENPNIVSISLEQPEQYIPIFDSRYNSIHFEFAVPSYTDETRNLYQYYLEGFDKGWSEWTALTQKEYTNLPHGNYRFRVRAMNVYENLSNEAVYEFIILRPWYRTYWAYGMFIFLFFALSYTGIRISNIRLRQAKVRLERIVRDRTKEIFAQKIEIEKEKEKSDQLLLNILPQQTAEELKRDGFARTRFYASATVLFSDFVGFTRIAEALSPQALIRELDRCFVMMDDICDRLNVEKIKTIGDAYMCAGGVPVPNNTHHIDVVLAGFELLANIKRISSDMKNSTGFDWKIRIGIHSGELIAGVVGKNKFAFDIWGDAVNTANRVEEMGAEGRINISGATYELISEYFDCTYRGRIPAKNKGEIDMYFVDRLKPAYAKDQEGMVPNEVFYKEYERIKNIKKTL